MSWTCKNCIVDSNLEEKRYKLNKSILPDCSNILDYDIVNLSQELDYYIVICSKCKNRLTSLISSDMKDVFGKQSRFYYYGFNHLFENIINYIKIGIEMNEKIILLLSYNFYERIVKELNDINLIHIKKIHIEELLEIYLFIQREGLEKKIDEIILKYQNEGYTGIRIINEINLCTSLNGCKEIFFNEDIQRLIKQKNCSIVELHNFYTI